MYNTTNYNEMRYVTQYPQCHLHHIGAAECALNYLLTKMFVGVTVCGSMNFFYLVGTINFVWNCERLVIEFVIPGKCF